MNALLAEQKKDALKWVAGLIPDLKFIVVVSNQNRRQWQEELTNNAISLPSEAGIYLIYPMGSEMPVYIGQASDLRNRLTFHFSDSASSNNESTVKKYLKKYASWDGSTPIGECFRVRFFVLSFGRLEIEEHLHQTYKVNTSRVK